MPFYVMAVEAVRWTGDNSDAVMHLLNSSSITKKLINSTKLSTKTVEQKIAIFVKLGQWLVKKPDGDIDTFNHYEFAKNFTGMAGTKVE